MTPTVTALESKLGSQKSERGPASQPHNSTQKQKKRGKTNNIHQSLEGKLINEDRTEGLRQEKMIITLRFFETSPNKVECVRINT